MSGGHWEYRQRGLDDIIEKLPTVVQFAQDCLNEMDLLLSGDVSTESAQEKLLKLTKELGDYLYEGGEKV